MWVKGSYHNDESGNHFEQAVDACRPNPRRAV